jgi:hypothetical protein
LPLCGRFPVTWQTLDIAGIPVFTSRTLQK